MTRRPPALASVAAALLILPALSGCVLQKKVIPPVVAVAPPPAPTPTPLYTSELAQADNSFPKLPPVAVPAAQPAPPPQSEVQLVKKHVSNHRSRRGETEVAERGPREGSSREPRRERESSAASDPSGGDPQASPGSADSIAKVTAKPPAGDSGAATPIGQLTAGPAQDAPQSRKEAADLIQSTERGLNSLHRGLSGDESKTVTQIHSFLQQATHALHNGDIDGAYTLATKAKVLLTELTGSE